MVRKGNRLVRRIFLLRWALPLAIFLFACGWEVWEHAFLLPGGDHTVGLAHPFFFFVDVSIYGAAGALVSWLVLSWIAGRVAEQQRAQEELERVYASLQQMHARLHESTAYLSAVHEISRAIASTVDLREMADQIVQAVCHTAGAEYACLRLLDEEQGRWTLVSSSCPEEPDNEEFLHMLTNNLVVWRSGTRRPVWAEVRRLAPSDGSPLRLLGVPVARGEVLLGAIHLCFTPGEIPTDSQVNLLTTIADEIAAAIEAARLRARDLQALYEVDQTIRAEFNLDRLLEQILDKMVQLCSADAGTIMLLEEGTHELVLAAALPRGQVHRHHHVSAGSLSV